MTANTDLTRSGIMDLIRTDNPANCSKLITLYGLANF